MRGTYESALLRPISCFSALRARIISLPSSILILVMVSSVESVELTESSELDRVKVRVWISFDNVETMFVIIVGHLFLFRRSPLKYEERGVSIGYTLE